MDAYHAQGRKPRSRASSLAFAMLLLGAAACGGGGNDLPAVSTLPPAAPTLSYSASGTLGFPVRLSVQGPSSKLTYDWQITSPGTTFNGSPTASGPSVAFTATTTGPVTLQCTATRSNGVKSPAATATVSISQPSNSLGSFQFDGTLSTARRGLAAALLTPDSILVTGGWDGAVSGTALKTAEIYNIPQQTSTQAHSMTTGRAGHSLVQLPSSSQFLVIGGAGGSDPASLTSAELYALGQFTAVTGGMASERTGATATAIGAPAGVFVAGGVTGGGFQTDSEEQFILSSNTFRSAGTQPLAPGHSATLVGSRVLLVSRTASGAPFATLYDPATGTYVDTANQPASGRSGHQAVLLPPQGAAAARVLILGGSSGGAPLASAEYYDLGTNRFTPLAAAMASPRQDFAAVRLDSGKVLILGGTANGQSAVGTAELFDPVALTFTPISGLGAPRRNPVAFLLNDGRVLVLGGTNESQGALASVEAFTPTP